MTHPSAPPPHWWRLLLLAGLLAGFGLRLFQLGAESLWYDETVSALLASKPSAALIQHTAGDIHPPGYYLVLHLWHWLVNPSPAHGLEFLLAWPSLTSGLICVALLAALGRRLFSPAVGTTALWLAAIHPFQIWYSQEVRMYTLAALWALLCMWAVLQAGTGRHPLRWLALYVAAAAAGLYTLYYFVFLLVALNLAVILWWLSAQRPFWWKGGRQFAAWGLAQVAIVLLWLPWLPMVWRQVSDPPVPGWRISWVSLGDFGQSVNEGLAALLVGQTAPGGLLWPWALVAIAVSIWALVAWRSSRDDPGQSVFVGIPGSVKGPTAPLLLLVLLLTPILLIYLISVLFTPIYHVRYLFPFVGPFILLMAAALVALFRRRAALGVIVGLSYTLLSAWALQQFWYAPQYRPDDHRAAVAALAASWRPGDAILVNAGWVYSALAVYWPRELAGAEASLPPAPATQERLTALTMAATVAPTTTTAAQPVILVTGSVDGGPDLGWGEAESDFYAMPLTATLAALETLPGRYNRLWHYRLYDTVSDPTGVIRQWLATNATLAEDQPIAGRDFLRLQRYDFPATAGGQSDEPTPASQARFGDQVVLTKVTLADRATAGAYSYITTKWQFVNPAAPLPELALSLRLYGPDDLLLTQADSRLTPPAAGWTPDAPYQVVLALPVPAAARPLSYTLALVVYEQANGQPLPVEPAGNQTGRFSLGEVQLVIPSTVPEVDWPLATFDYLDLIQARVPARLPAGGIMPVDLVWRPRASSYQDTFVALLSLQDKEGRIYPVGEAVLGGWEYPSGAWPPILPVLQQMRLPLPSGLPMGAYTLRLQLLRASDRQVVPSAGVWPWTKSTAIALGDILIGP